MATQRKQYRAEFKARVAMEGLQGHKTLTELVSMYGGIPPKLPSGEIIFRASYLRFSPLGVKNVNRTRRRSAISSTSKWVNSRTN
jgi:hypothetical protein